MGTKSIYLDLTWVEHYRVTGSALEVVSGIQHQGTLVEAGNSKLEANIAEQQGIKVFRSTCVSCKGTRDLSSTLESMNKTNFNSDAFHTRSRAQMVAHPITN